MPIEPNKKLEDCDYCELKGELRKRETEYANPGAKRSRPLAAHDSQTICNQLIKKETIEYGVSNRKLVYGSDDREDLFQVGSAEIRQRADAVLAMIDMSRISDNGDGSSTIRTVRFADAQNLCNSERFGQQPTGPSCTGFLVAPDIVATAGHCVNNNDLARTRFFFGFQMIDKDNPRLLIPNDDIFRGVAIIDRKLESTTSDYALVKLDRPVANRPILKLRRSGKISDDANVYVIGHPSGLPLKFADGAYVRGNDDPVFFVANLDTYGGNSGSPVFNQDTHEVEGILVRGDADFVSNGSCNISNVCPITGCRGEDVTRVSEFKNNVPLTTSTVPVDSSLDARVTTVENTLTKISQDLSDIKAKLP